jgi:phage shock protein A
MASTQVVVQVLDGSSVVDESIRRPVRLTPDGFAGIVYAGAVYPLLSGNTVDIAGPSWEIEDCNRFLLEGTAIPYVPRRGEAPSGPDLSGFGGEWNVETNRFGHYIVFNASERIATGIVDALENGGLSVQRWDVSHRPASDGRFYDWFARLRFKGTHEECVARVSAIFAQTVSDIPAPAAPAPSVARLEELEAQVEQLLDQVVALRSRLDTSELEVAELRKSLAGTMAREAKLSADLDRALEHQKSLHEQLDEIRASPEYSPDTSALLAQQSETEELLELALAENADLRHRAESLRQQTNEGDARIQTLEATVLGLQEQLEEIGEQERERRRSTMTRLAPRRGVPGFLDSAFARLVFVLDSVEVLANLVRPGSAGSAGWRCGCGC